MKKLTTCANNDKHYLSVKTPTSKNAATGAGWEDLPTKALNRGTKDVNNRNVGHEDPCPEASAKGTSAESAGTLVLFESAPHEMQNELQDSLPLTPRLPTECKPDECKQEAAESIVTAGHTDRMVGMTEPHEMDADVDGMAALGGELVERVQGVSEGNKMEHDGQSRLQQIELYCKESRQCNENANTNENVPNAHGVPLEGEWIVCASGETSNPNGVKSEGCRGGMSG